MRSDQWWNGICVVATFIAVLSLSVVSLEVDALGTGETATSADGSHTHDEGTDNDGDGVGLVLLLAILLTIPSYLVTAKVHDLGQFLAFSYYRRKGIDAGTIAPGNVKKSPYGRAVMAGYRTNLLFAVLMIGFFPFGVMYEESGGLHNLVVMVFAFLLTVAGFSYVTYSRKYHEFPKWEDRRKLNTIQCWVDKGCRCGNSTFRMHNEELTCQMCGTMVDRFSVQEGPRLPFSYTLSSLLFEKKRNHIVLQSFIPAPIERVWQFLSGPPNDELLRVLRITDIRQIDEHRCSFREGGKPFVCTTLVKREPEYLLMDYSHVDGTDGDKDGMSHFSRAETNLNEAFSPDGSERTRILLERTFAQPVRPVMVELYFLTVNDVMKRFLERESVESPPKVRAQNSGS